MATLLNKGSSSTILVASTPEEDAADRYERCLTGDIGMLLTDFATDSLAAAYADRAYIAGLPFLPAFFDLRKLFIGPWIVPHNGVCWNCWRRRSFQHSSHPEALLHLRRHQDKNQSMNAALLEPQALLAAAHYTNWLWNFDSARPGEYLEIDLLNGGFTQSLVIGIHDCPLCGLHMSATSRTYETLQTELAALWNPPLPGR
jgi:bacteriocin biosynthesis cyclodehydratase domain-containing protein